MCLPHTGLQMRLSTGVSGSSCPWDPARSGHSQAAVWVASLGFSPAVTIVPPSTVYPGNESDLVNVVERKLVTKKDSSSRAQHSGQSSWGEKGSHRHRSRITSSKVHLLWEMSVCLYVCVCVPVNVCMRVCVCECV